MFKRFVQAGRKTDVVVHSVGFLPPDHANNAALKEANMLRTDLPRFEGKFIVTFQAYMKEHEGRVTDLIAADGKDADLRPVLLSASIIKNEGQIVRIPSKGEKVKEISVIPVQHPEDNAKPRLSEQGPLSGLPIYNVRITEFYPADAGDEVDPFAVGETATEQDSEVPLPVATEAGSVLEG